MTKDSLRFTANKYLKTEKRGSFKDRKYRSFIIHKMLDDLFCLKSAPPSWQHLNDSHIKRLIYHWQKQGLSPSTLMNYMKVIREFLKSLGGDISDLDNQSLDLIRKVKQKKKKLNINPDSYKLIQKENPHFILGFQTLFGLTFSEAIYFISDIHYRDQMLWITRDIAFNSKDRTIPIRDKKQSEFILKFKAHTQGSKNLIQIYGYELLRAEWRHALRQLNLPIKNYRYLYAKKLYKTLLPIIGSYQLKWLIRDEMGVQSRTTVWSYLNE